MECLKTLWKYIAKNIKNGWITLFTNPAGSPVLFVLKDDGTLCQMCHVGQGSEYHVTKHVTKHV